MNRRIPGIALAAAFALAMGGCATRTPVSGQFPAITPRAAQGGGDVGRTVRWGGVLIDTSPEAGRTCFRVMGLPLAADGRPETGSAQTETGRFIACSHGFYDPVLYAAGRKITFVGTVAGVEEEAVGGYHYRYPKLAASVVYLWPRPSPAPATPAYYGMYYGWGPWGWPSAWGPDWWWWSPWGLTPPPPYVRPLPQPLPPPLRKPPPGGGAHEPLPRARPPAMHSPERPAEPVPRQPEIPPAAGKPPRPKLPPPPKTKPPLA